MPTVSRNQEQTKVTIQASDRIISVCPTSHPTVVSLLPKTASAVVGYHKRMLPPPPPPPNPIAVNLKLSHVPFLNYVWNSPHTAFSDSPTVTLSRFIQFHCLPESSSLITFAFHSISLSSRILLFNNADAYLFSESRLQPLIWLILFRPSL